MCNPIFSIVVLTYNQQDYIEECLNSILLQGNEVTKSTELIISDDCSTDNTPKFILSWIEKYGALFHSTNVKIHEKNLGISENHKYGVYQSTGQFIKYIGGDDIFLPQALSSYFSFFKENQEAEVVVGDIMVMNDRKPLSPGLIFNSLRPKKKNNRLFDLDSVGQFNELCVNNFIPAPALCFRRDVVYRYNFFTAGLKSFEDWPTWLELTNANIKFYKLDVAILIWRRHQNAGSLDSFKKKDTQFYLDNITTIEKFIFPNIDKINLITRYKVRLNYLQNNIIIKYGFNRFTKLLVGLIKKIK